MIELAETKLEVVSEYFFTAQEGVNGASFPDIAPEDESLDKLMYCVLVFNTGGLVMDAAYAENGETYDELKDIARRNAYANFDNSEVH
jgi:hypothetical protein